jgi:ribosomal protein S7
MGPVLLLVCGAVSLYLVAVSHFIVSCLDQIRQAVETTRLAYLPEAVRQQQDAVNVERLHRFAAVVRYASEASTRRQAALNVQVMALNSSPSRAAGSRARLREAARLVAELAELRTREARAARRQCMVRARLLLARRNLSDGDPQSSELRRKVDDLLAEDGAAPLLATGADAASIKLSGSVGSWLAEAEDAKREAQLVGADVEAVWKRCEEALNEVADSIGASACLSLDALIVDLAGQVHNLQRLVAWLLALTFLVLLAVAHFVYRRLVSPVLAFARATAGGPAPHLPEQGNFRELCEIAEALQGADDKQPTAGSDTTPGTPA